MAIFIAGFNIVISMYFTSIEKALPTQIVSLSRGFVVIIPMAYFLSLLLGMTGMWLSYPFAEGVFMEIPKHARNVLCNKQVY